VVRLASSRIAVTLAAAVALALAASWLAPAGALQSLAATLAFLAPFVGRIVSALNRLSPLLDAVEADARAEADLRRERAALAEAREAAMRVLAQREAAATKALTGVEAVEKAAATPQAMLRFFLNESDELRGYEREIGMVGRLRRSFQRLDDLMAAQVDPGRETRDDLPVLDRIILYIDDLDRLREDQVVKVLEAVGLLLQFRLFVVVVAVDARWLEGALRQFYHGQLGREGQAGPGDYLEKIFQVPFWLPRLAGGESFRGLARVLLPEGTAMDARGGEPVAAPPQAPSAPEDDAYALDPDEAPQPGDAASVETRAAAVERVTLTQPEVEVLTTLMPLAATGPRGAKRFVNLYRLARASRSGEELRRFLGEDGEAPDFPALAFLLAVTCGCTAAEWAAIYRFLSHEWVSWVEPGRVISWIDVETGLIERYKPSPPEAPSSPSGPWQRLSGAEWPDAMRTLSWKMVAAHLAEATRYSFHPPGRPPALDRAAAPANPAPDQPGSTA
jgi:hypothetical protein